MSRTQTCFSSPNKDMKAIKEVNFVQFLLRSLSLLISYESIPIGILKPQYVPTMN